MTDYDNTAKIEIRNDFARISPPAADVLRPFLEGASWGFVPNPDGVLDPRRSSVPFCQDDAQDSLVIPVGLVQRARQVLHHAGYRVDELDHSCWPHLAKADEKWLASTPLSADLWQLQQAISKSPLGQIFQPTPEQLWDAVAMHARLFSAVNTCIVVKNRNDARRAKTEIRGRVGLRFHLYDAPLLWREKTVRLVACPATAALCRPEDFGLMIFLGSETLASHQIRTSQVWRSNGICRYLYRHDLAETDLSSQLWLETLVGPVINAPTPWAQAAVLAIGPFASPPECEGDALERKRRNLWRNTARNRGIAQAALAVADGDETTLRRLAMLDPPGISPWISSPDPSVAVLVETAEHGRELHRLLPGFELYAGQDATTLEETVGLPLMPARAVVTMLRAHRRGVAADIIIRADGTASSWGRDFEPHWFSKSRVLVVDVADKFDAMARRDTRARWTNYANRGWTILEAAGCWVTKGNTPGSCRPVADVNPRKEAGRNVGKRGAKKAHRRTETYQAGKPGKGRKHDRRGRGRRPENNRPPR